MSIYFQQQLESRGGLCAVNHVLQNHFYTSLDFDNLAQQLNSIENNLIIDNDGEHTANNASNYDAFGNYSIQVLIAALNTHHLTLTTWNERVDPDPTIYDCFIVNQNEHWYTIRRIRGRYWILNSLEQKPSHISDFALTALLGGLNGDNLSISIVTGPLHDGEEDPNNMTGGTWFQESVLLQGIAGFIGN